MSEDLCVLHRHEDGTIEILEASDTFTCSRECLENIINQHNELLRKSSAPMLQQYLLSCEHFNINPDPKADTDTLLDAIHRKERDIDNSRMLVKMIVSEYSRTFDEKNREIEDLEAQIQKLTKRDEYEVEDYEAKEVRHSGVGEGDESLPESLPISDWLRVL